MVKLSHQSMTHPRFAYSKITPTLYLGTNLCCAKHGSQLLRLKVTIDISLEEERFDIPHELTTFLWLPVPDHHAPTNEQLFIGTSVLTEAEEKGYIVYAHCKNGHGRSPSLVIAHFIRKGMPYEKAYKFVASKRPEIDLTYAQISALKSFASLL